MKKTILTFLFLAHLVTFGQYPRQKALLEIIKPDLKQLHQDKIDSITYFMPYSVGDRKGFTTERSASQQVKDKIACEISDVIYLLWQKKGKTYITKYNECGKIQTVSVDTVTFIQEFAKNYDIIKGSSVKPFQSLSSKNDTLTLTLNHSERWDVFTEINGKKYTINIDLYNLVYSFGSDRNINADFNNGLVLIKLLQKMSGQLETIAFNTK